MNTSSIIEFLVKSENGLSKNEIEKINSEYDRIYFDEKIKEHLKKARMQKGVIWALLIFYVIASVLLVAKSAINPTTLFWLQGFLIALCVLILLLMPSIFKNHSRIAYTLKIIREIKQNN